MSIYNELETKRIEFFENFKEKRDKGRLSILGILFSLLFMIIFIKRNMNGLVYVGLIGLLASIIVLVVFYSQANKYKSTFNKLVKDEFVHKILKDYFDDIVYEGHEHIEISKIINAGLTLKPDRHEGEDLIKGKYKDINFEVSDITLTQRVVTSNGKTTTVQYVDYFKGRWYIYQFPKRFNQTLKIFERGQNATTKELKRYETEMIDFNKKFRMFSSDEQFFYYILDPLMIERLIALEKIHKGTIHYAFINNELHIGINDNSDSLHIDFYREINEESLKTFRRDIKLIKRIVDELRLTDNKFIE